MNHMENPDPTRFDILRLSEGQVVAVGINPPMRLVDNSALSRALQLGLLRCTLG